MAKRSLLGRIGPAFIVGACIIGPGSVTLMSKTGAAYGYALVWLSLLSGALMAGFLAVFMRFGIYCDETFLGLTAKKLGRWFAVLCGLSLFSVDATFQFGNALGVKAGMQAIFPAVSPYVWPIAFTVAAIVFLFAFKRIYGLLEKTMTFFLVFMVIAFLVNLTWARPNPVEVLRGVCVPTLPAGVDWVIIGGLVGTTFVIVAAFMQPYLVKAKGWTEKDLASGVTDTVLASIMLTLVGAMIMITAAAVIHPLGLDTDQVNFELMISQLEKGFGSYAKLIFSVGFFAAAFSSFITNSVIGGVLLCDGLGLGGRLESIPTKVFATLVLLIGMSTGLLIIFMEQTRAVNLTVKAIALGQATTMLAVPLGTVAMVAVLFDRRANRGRPRSLWLKAFVLFGATVLLGIAAVMYVKIKPQVMGILGL
jgi:manganese transport protein